MGRPCNDRQDGWLLRAQAKLGPRAVVRLNGNHSLAVASGRYRDRFERRDGAWRFTSREVSTDLVGDVSHHVKAAA
jgi:hypothetical protein